MDGKSTYEVTVAVKIRGVPGSEAVLAKAVRRAMRGSDVGPQLCEVNASLAGAAVRSVRVVRLPRLRGPQCLARFTRQVWDGDYARTIGEGLVDVTRQVLELNLDDLRGLTDCSFEADGLVAGTPEGDAHEGPFEVSVVDQACELFGVGALAEVTAAMLQAGRARAGLVTVKA